MTNQHPIIPPFTVMDKWRNDSNASFYDNLISAAQWGADQELNACAKWIRSTFGGYSTWADKLRDARRSTPKPPSLKKQALTALHAIATGANDTREQHQDLDTIRKALEALND
jgi:hypothetical protein